MKCLDNEEKNEGSSVVKLKLKTNWFYFVSWYRVTQKDAYPYFVR